MDVGAAFSSIQNACVDESYIIQLVVFSVTCGALSVWLGSSLGYRKALKDQKRDVEEKRAEIQRIMSRERIISKNLIRGMQARSGMPHNGGD